FLAEEQAAEHRPSEVDATAEQPGCERQLQQHSLRHESMRQLNGGDLARLDRHHPPSATIAFDDLLAIDLDIEKFDGGAGAHCVTPAAALTKARTSGCASPLPLRADSSG